MTRALGIPYTTPHCQNGGHQNSKVLSLGGALMPACRGIYVYRFVQITCKCWCHEMFASLAAEQHDALTSVGDSNVDAITAGNVDPVPLGHVVGMVGAGVGVPADSRSSFWSSAITDESVEPQLWDFVNKVIFDGMEHRSQSLQDRIGQRRRRGSLDVNVEIVCRLWLDRKLPFTELTPASIGMMINADDMPSPGAIYAVLSRWKDNNLCATEEKPFRFVGFTPAVDEHGIAYAKHNASREKVARLKGFF